MEINKAKVDQILEILRKNDREKVIKTFDIFNVLYNKRDAQFRNGRVYKSMLSYTIKDLIAKDISRSDIEDSILIFQAIYDIDEKNFIPHRSDGIMRVVSPRPSIKVEENEDVMIGFSSLPSEAIKEAFARVKYTHTNIITLTLSRNELIRITEDGRKRRLKLNKQQFLLLELLKECEDRGDVLKAKDIAERLDLDVRTIRTYVGALNKMFENNVYFKDISEIINGSNEGYRLSENIDLYFK